MKPAFYLIVMAALAAFAAAFAAPAAAADVAVLLAPAERGARITAADLDTAEVQDGMALGALGADAIIGMEATRNIAAGRPLRAHDLREPLAVERGAEVVLVVERGPLTITARGRALQNGSIGETVRVQAGGSRALVTGEIVGEGRVAVGGGR